MKATKNIPDPVPPTFTLELNETEAKALYAIAGAIGDLEAEYLFRHDKDLLTRLGLSTSTTYNGDVRRACDSLYSALKKAGVERA